MGLGISINDLKMMLEINSEIKELDDIEIKEKIEILKLFGLTEKSIRHIIVSNPLYLSRSNDDIKGLLKKLNDFGFEDFDLIFETNPFLLNNDAYELDDYIEERRLLGKSLEDTLDEFECNFYTLD